MRWPGQVDDLAHDEKGNVSRTGAAQRTPHRVAALRHRGLAPFSSGSDRLLQGGRKDHDPAHVVGVVHHVGAEEIANWIGPKESDPRLACTPLRICAGVVSVAPVSLCDRWRDRGRVAEAGRE